jgi:hypothetical protein
MLVKMRARISGTRNGADWPEVGGTVDLPDAEAVDMLNAGLVEPAEVVVEAAIESPLETATAPKRPRRSDG